MGELSDDDKRELEDLRRKLAGRIAKATFEEKRRILKRLRVKCIWNDRTGELTASGLFAGKVIDTTSFSASDTLNTTQKCGLRRFMLG